MNQQIRRQLYEIEGFLHSAGLWQNQPPGQQALSSSEPFCLDTLTPLQWLQWILLPRMHALLDSQSALPDNFVVAPYYEVALEEDVPQRARLLHLLTQLDARFGEGQ